MIKLNTQTKPLEPTTTAADFVGAGAGEMDCGDGATTEGVSSGG